MAQLRCPKCSTLVLAEPGETVRCPSCGFSATAPATPQPTASVPASGNAGSDVRVAVPPPAGVPTVAQPLRMLSVWGFLASLVALGTFYLASVGVPFALGAIGCTLGLVAFSKNRKDRHGLVATILGAVSLVLAVVFLSLG